MKLMASILVFAIGATVSCFGMEKKVNKLKPIDLFVLENNNNEKRFSLEDNEMARITEALHNASWKALGMKKDYRTSYRHAIPFKIIGTVLDFYYEIEGVDFSPGDRSDWCKFDDYKANKIVNTVVQETIASVSTEELKRIGNYTTSRLQGNSIILTSFFNDFSKKLSDADMFMLATKLKHLREENGQISDDNFKEMIQQVLNDVSMSSSSTTTTGILCKESPEFSVINYTLALKDWHHFIKDPSVSLVIQKFYDDSKVYSQEVPVWVDKSKFENFDEKIKLGLIKRLTEYTYAERKGVKYILTSFFEHEINKEDIKQIVFNNQDELSNNDKSDSDDPDDDDTYIIDDLMTTLTLLANAKSMNNNK